jgi:hypothetical protein
MEESRFDLLLRKAAQQTTRRETLGALLGSALLLGDVGGSEATRKGKRRKRRKRAAGPNWVGVKIIVNNAAGASEVPVQWGGYGPTSCCAPAWSWNVPARGSWDFGPMLLPVAAGASAEAGQQLVYPGTWVWISNTYWFHIQNPLVGAPHVQIALNGKHPDRACCAAIPTGLPVEGKVSYKPKQSRTFNIAGKLFTVARDADAPQYKGFTITLPAGI